MALNLFEMLAQLKMGVDIETITPYRNVPHAFQVGYTPAYTIRNDAGDIIYSGGDVDQLVEQAHCDTDSLTLWEDEYPVFTVH